MSPEEQIRNAFGTLIKIMGFRDTHMGGSEEAQKGARTAFNHADRAWDKLDRDVIEALKLEAVEQQLAVQLPEGMEHCTIQFIECPVGHGQLRATNWIYRGCTKCQLDKLTEALRKVRSELHTASIHSNIQLIFEHQKSALLAARTALGDER